VSITKDVLIEELVARYPGSVSFLIGKGLPCVVCGDPFWGSLSELARQNGWTEDRIESLVEEFNRSQQRSDKANETS
jgi:Ni,Fe-hydrogenase I small subunit